VAKLGTLLLPTLTTSLLAALAALVGLLLAFSSLSSPDALEEALVRVGARHSA